MCVDTKVEDAFHVANPLEQLRALAISMQEEGHEQSTILDFFERNRQALREAGREQDEDVVLEVMDFLVGWCSPHMSLATKKTDPNS
ncbi:MAG: hypothetical protein ACREHD_27040 [Pirellulales bacterium]